MKRASSSKKNQDVHKILRDLESDKAAYPPDLLAARRAAFLEQIAQRTETVPEEKFSVRDQKVLHLLRKLKEAEDAYPVYLWHARRAAYRRQIVQLKSSAWLQRLRSAIADTVALATRSTQWRRSLVLAMLAVAAYLGFASYGNRGELVKPLAPSNAVPQTTPVAIHPHVTAEARIFCKPGFTPPLCLAQPFDKSNDLSYAGNGVAHPAVAKDTVPGFEGIHRAAYVNDGLYGPGASWVSNSADSWIKIDLGQATKINAISFGKDRLGQREGGDPGQFVIAVALNDDIYADGNSSNDEYEYIAVYSSKEAGFDGLISGGETITARFEPRLVRYLKITFENKGAAVDEVEAFLVKPPMAASNPTKEPKERIPRTATPLPTSTPTSTNTATPTDTFTPTPTDTATPTDTPSPTPTNTPTPTDTNTPTPTDTPTSVPTDTPTPTETASPPSNFFTLTDIPTSETR